MPLNPQIPLTGGVAPVMNQQEAITRALQAEDMRLKRDMTLRDLATGERLRQLYARPEGPPSERELLQFMGPAAHGVIKAQADAQNAKLQPLKTMTDIGHTQAQTAHSVAQTAYTNTQQQKTGVEAQKAILERDQFQRKEILSRLWPIVSMAPEYSELGGESPQQAHWAEFRKEMINKGFATEAQLPETYVPQIAQALTQQLVSDHDNFQARLDAMPKVTEQPKFAADWNVELGRVAQGLRPNDVGGAANAREYLRAAGAPKWIEDAIPQNPSAQDIAALKARGLTVEETAQTTTAARSAATGERNAQLRASELDNSAGLTTALTPQARDIYAIQFLQTGQLPTLGAGKIAVAEKNKIANRAAELAPQHQPAIARAMYVSNTNSLKQLTTQANSMSAFENTALKNLKVFMDAAQKIADSGSPYFNRPLRTFSSQVLGSPEMAAAMTARRTVVPEFARLLGGGNLSSVLSDSSRHEVDQLLDESATLAQWQASAKVLVADAHNRRESTQQEIAAVRQAIQQLPTSMGPPADILDRMSQADIPAGARVTDNRTGRVWVKGASGEIEPEVAK